MGDCNDQGPAAGPYDPPTIVPDSIRVSAQVAAGEKEPAPPAAACFADQSQSSHLPLLVGNKPNYPASGTDVDGRSLMIPSPDPTVVLSGDAGAARFDHNAPNNGRAGETPQQQQGLAAAGLDPLQLPTLPEIDASPELPPQPRPGSAQPSPSNQNNTGSAVYSPAWWHLVRQVGAAPATRPSLCACKKLAVAAMLSSDDGKGGATQRPGRVCADRGKEADCLYRAFNDAPIVPSTTVSSKTLSLLLHMEKSDPSTPTEREGERTEEERTEEEEEAESKNGDGKRERGRDGDPGGGSPDGTKEGGDGVKNEKNLGGVGEGKEHQYRHGQGATESLGMGAASQDQGKVVLVEVRRWLMDCVASVHCADTALREAMSRLVPPELGQTHPSPDGGGQLIALHVAAVTLLVESLPTLPGVLQVEGADKTASIFTSAQAVPPTAITPARRPTSVGPQQPGRSARLPRQNSYSSTTQRVAAPVPIRASEMVAPSIWGPPNMGGEESGNGSGRRGGGAAAGGGSGAQASGAAGQNVGGTSSHAGGLGCSGASSAGLLGGGGVDVDVDVDGTAEMLSVPGDSTLFSIEADQQLPGWGSKAAAATAWPALGSRSRHSSESVDGAGGGGDSIGGAWADSAGCGSSAAQGGSDAGIYRQGQGQQQVSAPSVISSHSSTSSFYDCHYAEAAAPKRQKTDSSVALGVARPVGQHLQGYASLFSGDASAPLGNTFGGALAYSASSKLGDSGVGGIGGIGLDDLAGDSFGTSGGDAESAWVDAVFDREPAFSSSPFLLNDK